MGNTVHKRDKRSKPKLKSRSVSRISTGTVDLEGIRKSLEPNIGGEIKDCTALFDCTGYSQCDLEFKKGDHFHNVRRLRDQSDWLLATHTGRRERGFVPRDYVCQDSVPEYYQDVGKTDRERLLLAFGIFPGTYIVTQKQDKIYRLEVRSHGSTNVEDQVNSYTIKTGRDGRVFVFLDGRTFESVTSLLENYKENELATGCVLKYCLEPPRRTIPPRELEVKVDSFQLEDMIGKGTYGDVYRGSLCGKIPVAVQLVSLDERNTDVTPDQVLHVAKHVSSFLNHNCFVQILGLSKSSNSVHILYELMTAGNLRDVLWQDQGKTIRFKHCVDIACQICEGMAYLEAKQQVFRCELRCSNILVGPNLQIKIKTSVLVRDPFIEDIDDIKSLRWRAPECVYDLDKCTVHSDVWSFGVTLFEIVTHGQPPFRHIPPSEIAPSVARGRFPDKPATRIPYMEVFWDGAMTTCFTKDPESRPTFASLRAIFDENRMLIGAVPEYECYH